MPPLPLDLPAPSSAQLRHAPLKFVVCQVRHDRNLAVGDARVALDINRVLAEKMGESLHLEQQSQQEVGFAFGPGGMVPMPNEQQQVGWRLRSASGNWVVALLPDFFALECTGYTSWTEFARRLTALCEVVEQRLAPAIEMRLGLRYVDEIRLPEVRTPEGWHGFIDDSVLGSALHPALGPAVQAAQQVVQLLGPEGMQVILRHGTQPDEDMWPYVLDTDCFRENTRPFDATTLIRGANDLHRLSLQVFQAVVTPRLRTVLGA